MTTQKLREKIEKKIRDTSISVYRPDLEEWIAYLADQILVHLKQHISYQTKKAKLLAYSKAYEKKIKETQWVLLADDQNLTENPYPGARICADENGVLTEYSRQEHHIYEVAQRAGKKSEQERILKYLKSLLKTNPKASLASTLGLIEVCKPKGKETGDVKLVESGDER